MQFSPEWQDDALNAAVEERQTVADLRIWLADQNVTLHLDKQASFDYVTISLYGIAEGIAYDWWRIFGARDCVFSLANYRTGYAVPDLQVSFDGVIFQVTAVQRDYRNPGIRFWSGPTEVMNRREAEDQLDRFVDDVLSRLDQRGVRDTSAALRWARVNESRGNAEEASFCESAGALGVDPYQVDDQTAESIEQAAALFESEPLSEFLAGARQTDKTRLLEWVTAVERRPRYQARVPDLRDVAIQVAGNTPARSNEPGWSLGYRRARSMRRALNLQAGDRFSSYKTVAEKLGASSSFRLAPDMDGIRVLRSDHDDGVRLHMRTHGSSPWARELRQFSFSRAVGDVVCFPEGARAPINGLRDAYRQAAGRAFAAEFLAPIDEIRSMQESGRDNVSIASDFGVSTTLITRQLDNKDRIEAACT